MTYAHLSTDRYEGEVRCGCSYSKSGIYSHLVYFILQSLLPNRFQIDESYFDKIHSSPSQMPVYTMVMLDNSQGLEKNVMWITGKRSSMKALIKAQAAAVELK